MNFAIVCGLVKCFVFIQNDKEVTRGPTRALTAPLCRACLQKLSFQCVSRLRHSSFQLILSFTVSPCELLLNQCNVALPCACRWHQEQLVDYLGRCLNCLNCSTYSNDVVCCLTNPIEAANDVILKLCHDRCHCLNCSNYSNDVARHLTMLNEVFNDVTWMAPVTSNSNGYYSHDTNVTNDAIDTNDAYDANYASDVSDVSDVSGVNNPKSPFVSGKFESNDQSNEVDNNNDTFFRTAAWLLRCGDIEANPGPGPVREPNVVQIRMKPKGVQAVLQVISQNVRGLSDSKKVRHLVNKCYKLSKASIDSIYCFQETYVPKLDLLNYLWRGEVYVTSGTGNSLGCITLMTAPFKIARCVELGQ